ncbi:uncharacterized protein LOC129616308 isoform X2 [Condylostylus longicornis]|uniref:uncharacterized protein LOC129616308 isoform X2 n=1 Tax=Condylostylus longicornis TaxID=2530218 RepID=UPI00244D9C07|nr:uncharacterized protein LOC129616308 isoform X2 [Condylostylus longicornis]
MVICAVFNCNSNSDKKLKRNMNDSSFKETKFFRFPKNKEIAKIWIQKCGRKDKFNIQSSYICSKHFVQEHYRRNLQHELLNYSPKNSKKLKDDAVPTENLPSAIESKSSETVSERLGRYIKKQRQETVTNILKIDNQIENLDCVEVHTNDEVQEKNSKCDQSTSTEDLNECKPKSPTKEQLKNDNKMLSKQCYFLKQENDCLKNIFTPNQRKKMAKKGNRVKWNIEDISESIAIYSSGPKAYRLLLKKKYPFPAVSTLKKWVSKIDINPGC